MGVPPWPWNPQTLRDRERSISVELKLMDSSPVESRYADPRAVGDQTQSSGAFPSVCNIPRSNFEYLEIIQKTNCYENTYYVYVYVCVLYMYMYMYIHIYIYIYTYVYNIL